MISTVVPLNCKVFGDASLVLDKQVTKVARKLYSYINF